MKLKTINITGAAALILILSACGGQTKRSNKDKLLEKKKELKNELSEIEAQLQDLDTSSNILLPLVKIDTLKTGTFIHKIEVQGAVESDLDAMINAEASGVITKIHVKEGQQVRKGQHIATIDAEILGKNIEEVKASLELADFVYEKQKKLYEEGVSSQLEFEQAKNNKKSLEQRLETLKTQKGKTNVTAPFSGYVDQVFAKQGAMASPQSPLLRLVNNETVKVTGNISERHLKNVGEGTPVELSFPALDTIMYHKITNRGKYIDPTNRTFRIQSVIKNNDFLLPNLAAVIRVTDVEEENAIMVDESSILMDNENQSYLFTLSAGEIIDGVQSYEVTKVIIDKKNAYKGIAWIVPQENIEPGSWIVTQGAKGITAEDIVRLN